MENNTLFAFGPEFLAWKKKHYLEMQKQPRSFQHKIFIRNELQTIKRLERRFAENTN